jgi:predicted transcriptional regulator
LKITDVDKVTLALLLEEGRAKVDELQFHLTMTRQQIGATLAQLVAQGKVSYEAPSRNYKLVG